MAAVKTLTRQELYDLVWSKPMRDLAAEFGMSDVGLAKICNRHRVPKPERGYWAKLQSGKKVKRAIFVELDDPQLNRIEIRGSLDQLPTEAREIVKKARAERGAIKSERRLSATEAKPPEPVQNVHAAIRPTAQILRKAKADATGAILAVGDGLCGTTCARGNVERVIAFLNDLANKLEAKGLPLLPAGQGMRVCRGQDSADFTLKEQTRREKHVPTPGELAAEERRQKRLQKYWSSPRSWDASSDGLYDRSYPEYDVIHTGELVFQIEGYADGVRRKWADGRTQTVESLLDGIVIGLETLLAVRTASREAQEERERQRQEIARRRALARERVDREEKRKTYLGRLIDLHDEIRRLRQWLAETELKSETRTHHDVHRLVAWAKDRLATLEATVDPGHIDQDLESRKLFPEVDELHDPEGEPPEQPRWW